MVEPVLYDPEAPLPYVLPQETPRNSTSLILENAHFVAGGQCRLFGFQGFNNKGTAQFIQVFDAAGGTVPADGVVPVFFLTVATVANFSAYFGLAGRWFYRGIWLCNSSTAATKTIGSADCWFDAQWI